MSYASSPTYTVTLLVTVGAPTASIPAQADTVPGLGASQYESLQASPQQADSAAS